MLVRPGRSKYSLQEGGGLSLLLQTLVRARITLLEGILAR